MALGQALQIGIYTLTLWAGFYCLSRDVRERRLVLIGIGISLCGFGLALNLIFELPYGALMGIISSGAGMGGLWSVRLYTQEQHQAFWPDLLRSLDYSMLAALVFGGQVALVIGGNRAWDRPTLALLLTIIASAIATQVFADSLQTALDKTILNRFPQLRRERAEIRAANSALPRIDHAVDFNAMDEAEFVRLTRRALSSLGDLPRLAASPLTYLPLVDAHLMQRGVEPNALTRANALKSILIERILHLKPSGADSGTSDAWRHYNALYYPYVLGMKPYTVRLDEGDTFPEHRAVLEWFRVNVPERTLHNWQTAAAKLIALDLRENVPSYA